MTGLAAAKQELRRAMRARRRAISDNQRQVAAGALALSAPRLAALCRGGTLSGFVAAGSEIDPAPLLTALDGRGVALALPCIEGEALVFRRWRPGDALRPATFGIMEPLPGAPVVHPQLMLLPLLAFDRAGNRLGYGGGYFDRTLAVRCPASVIGVGFAVQEVAHVPVEGHDHPLDQVLTEQGLFDCRAFRGA